MSAIANSNQPEEKPKTSRVPSWRTIPWKKLASLLMAIALCFYLTACGGDDKKQPVSKAPVKQVEVTKVKEVSPPDEIQRLSRLMERYNPQVSIVSPKPEEILNDTQVSVKFDVKNLPIFKNAEFGLGPHIHITLDNQEYKALYDLNQTVTFDHLSAGTHTIRAFASRPWHESFKNKGAYAQATFHVLTKTGENTPDAKTPAITYSRPVGVYGAEPVMLDFYIQNAPVHSLTEDEPTIDDWQVRATVNGQSFTFDRWEPIYLKGFKTGKNWVKLELLEDDGDPIPNAFNSTAHLIDFQPNGSDTLSRLVRGEKIANIDAIADPNYVPPAPEVIPAPTETIPSPEAKAPDSPESSQVVAPVPAAEVKDAKDAKPTTEVKTDKTEVKSESKTEPKPAEKAEKSDKVEAAPTSVIPVVPVPVVPVVPVPVAPVPVAPIKATPEAIAPAPKPTTSQITSPATKTAPTVSPIISPVGSPIKITPIKVIPKTEPIKVNPIVPVKAEPVKTEPVKAEPVKTEPAKAEPINLPAKFKSSPISAPVSVPVKVVPKVVPTSPTPKVTPTTEPVKTIPQPVKVAPTRIQSRFNPVTATPKAITTPTTPSAIAPITKEEPPAKIETPKAAAEPVVTKEEPKVETNKAKDYLKNFSFDPRKFFSSKKEEPKADVTTSDKPSDKPEIKAPEEVKTPTAKTDSKTETKPSEAPPALTDLSSTTSSPIKVLTKTK